MNIRTNLTDEQATINMIELAGYLADHEPMTTIEVSLNNLHMKFEAYTEDKESEHDSN